MKKPGPKPGTHHAGTFKKGNKAYKRTKNKGPSEWCKMKKLAEGNYEDAYKILWERVQAGESWAFNIFFDKLAPKRDPKDNIEFFLPTITEITNESIDGLLVSTVNLLQSFEHANMDEILKIIKTFVTMKAVMSSNSEDGDGSENIISFEELERRIGVCKDLAKMPDLN